MFCLLSSLFGIRVRTLLEDFPEISLGFWVFSPPARHRLPHRFLYWRQCQEHPAGRYGFLWVSFIGYWVDAALGGPTRPESRAFGTWLVRFHLDMRANEACFDAPGRLARQARERREGLS